MKCFRKVSENNAVMYDPTGICMDMGGASRKGAQNVFGDTFLQKVKS